MICNQKAPKRVFFGWQDVTELLKMFVLIKLYIVFIVHSIRQRKDIFLYFAMFDAKKRAEMFLM